MFYAFHSLRLRGSDPARADSLSGLPYCSHSSSLPVQGRVEHLGCQPSVSEHRFVTCLITRQIGAYFREDELASAS